MEPMPKTCQHKWVKNGTRRNRKSGVVQRWFCTKCRKPRQVYEHDPLTTRLQALALVARRLSLDQAECLTGIKSETIHKDWISLVSDPQRWAETQDKLSQFGLSDHELAYLRSMVEIASIIDQRLQPAGPNLQRDIAELKRRIETIIGCDVVIGTSRQGVRVCRKKDLPEFIRQIRKLPFDRLASMKRLSPKELKVLRQLHSPNSLAKLLSRLQPDGIEADPVTLRPLPPKLTMRLLGDGLNMDAAIFTGIAVALVHKLRRLTGSGASGDKAS